MDTTADPHRRSPLERFLALFTDVRPGEGLALVLLAVSIFLLLTAYYVIKPVREALILAGGGAEVKAYASAGQALLLLLTVPAYARLADRLPRRRLLTVVTMFFTGCLVVFYLLARTPLPLGVVFFLWVGIFNVTVIAQFWSLANDLYTTEAGKRLFAVLGFGASAGAVFGSWVAGQLIDPLGVYQLLLVSAALLVLSLVLSLAGERRRLRPDAGTPPPQAPDPAGASDGGAPPPQTEVPAGEDGDTARRGVWGLMRASGYLQLLALLSLLTNLVNTTGEYLLGELVTRTAREQALAGGASGQQAIEAAMEPWIGNFYADFFAVVNAVALMVQLFLVSRLVKYLGVRVCLLILPLIALGGYALLLVFPVLGVVRWAKTAENATDYSLQNTVRNMLWLPTTRQEKYAAKQFVDTFCVRVGDVLSAVVVFVGTSWLAFSIAGFAAVNLALVGLWLLVAVAIGRRFRQLTR
jgi:AAA family ATP:ADP antiporter